MIIGRRDLHTISNVLNTNFNFNNKMGLTLRVRHYLSSVHHKEFFDLQNDGNLAPRTVPTDNADYNVNFSMWIWSIPGSTLPAVFNLVWKDAAFTTADKNDTRYFNNLNGTLNSEQNNNFSVKVIYFIDYNSLRKKDLAKPSI